MRKIAPELIQSGDKITAVYADTELGLIRLYDYTARWDGEVLDYFDHEVPLWYLIAEQDGE